MIELSIIDPTFNKGDNIAVPVDATAYEDIFVDDDSDGAADLVRKLAWHFRFDHSMFQSSEILLTEIASGSLLRCGTR